MPNWCSNSVTLEHDDSAMIDRARKAFNNGQFLQEFVPVPKELMDEETTTHYGDAEREALANAVRQHCLDTYGYASWYDYCVNEWGTKWDVGEVGGIAIDETNSLTLNFDSAWSPPVAAYEKMLDLGFRITAYYYEPGMAYAGIWDNGDDACYEYGGLDSQGIRDEIPSELDEMFGISEYAEECERDEQDEVTTWYKDGVEDLKLDPIPPEDIKKLTS